MRIQFLSTVKIVSNYPRVFDIIMIGLAQACLAGFVTLLVVVVMVNRGRLSSFIIITVNVNEWNNSPLSSFIILCIRIKIV